MTNAHWLDKVIAEQAAHYGMTVERFSRFMGDAAEGQEVIEAEGEPSACPTCPHGRGFHCRQCWPKGAT